MRKINTTVVGLCAIVAITAAGIVAGIFNVDRSITVLVISICMLLWIITGKIIFGWKAVIAGLIVLLAAYSGTLDVPLLSGLFAFVAFLVVIFDPMSLEENE